MPKIMIKFFNMVEIALALAVLGVGIAGVLSLFPVGIKVMNDAIGENFSMSAADFFLGTVKNYVGVSTDNYDDIFTSDTTVTTARPTLAAINAATEDFRKYLAGQAHGGTITVLPPYSATDANVVYEYINSNVRCYFIKQGCEKIDFTAMFIIWKKTDSLKLYNADGTTSQDWPSPANYNIFGGLCMEMSWPLDPGVKYEDRQKKFFYTVIKKPE